jgi:hypothetical protein
MRHVNWPILLDSVIRQATTKPFCWGQHDCALFVADCIHAITGMDPAHAFRGAYDSEETADAALMDCAGGGIDALAYKMAADHGYATMLPAYAQRGDVVLCNLGHQQALGVVAMNGREVLLSSPQGLLARPLSIAVVAWRVE